MQYETYLPHLLSVLVIIMTIYFNTRKMKIQIEELEKKYLNEEENRKLEISKILLEQELTVYQNAFKNLMLINSSIHRSRFIAGMGDSGKFTKESKIEFDEIKKNFVKLREWYDKSCYLLGGEIKGDFILVLNLAAALASDLYYNNTTNESKLWESFLSVQKSLEFRFDQLLDSFSILRKNNF